uniref:Uncharacterized protein n=1 Tax=Anguilla anguilla TaxID=7936 RepID=A0A0E9SJE2_ANGAN
MQSVSGHEYTMLERLPIHRRARTLILKQARLKMERKPIFNHITTQQKCECS